MRFKTIVSRIIISVVPAVAVTTLIFMFVVYYIANQQINTTINEKMVESLEMADASIQNELQKNAAIAQSTAVFAKISNEQKTESARFSEFLLQSIPVNENTVGGGIWYEPNRFYADRTYFGPYVYMENGKAVFASEYENEVDYHMTNWYTDGKNSDGGIVWSHVYYDPVADVIMITSTQPFYDETGVFRGVTTADMSIDAIRKITSQISVGESGQAFLVGSNGQYIAFTDKGKSINDMIQEDPDANLRALGKTMMEQEKGVTSFVDGGVKKRVYFKTMEDVQWRLAVTIDESEISSTATQMIFLVSFLPLVGLALTVVGSILLTRYFRKIVGKVNDFADIAADGDFARRIVVTEQDEFGVMERRLNMMMSNMGKMNIKNMEMIQVAENASKAKGEFLSRMSHEIRTPMNAIIGMTQIADGTEEMGKIRNCLSKIDDASKVLLALINDILDMSKIESGKFELAPNDFDFGAMIEGVKNLTLVKSEKKQQIFSADIDPNIPRMMYGDEMRLAQVLTNILSNAVKFTPAQGTIDLRIWLIKQEDDVYTIEFRIKDSGIGLSPEQQSRMFRSFEQADGSISRRFGGTGLGLAISKSIVDKMEGTITVKSQLGEGSVFDITVPLQCGTDQENENEQDMPEEAFDFSNNIILLAEDIEINREILLALLEDTGITIDCAQNGVQVCEMFQANPQRYDLIFMDLQMPMMGGIEAAQTIREMAQGKDIPIVAMTANAFKEDVEKCIAAGMNDHIAKPIDLTILMNKLTEYLPKKDGQAH